MTKLCICGCGRSLSGRQRKYATAMCPRTIAAQKLCKGCNRHKSINSFNYDDSRTDGYYPWCKTCRAKYIKSLHKKSNKTDDNSRLCLTCSVGIGGSHANVRYCSAKCRNKAGLARMYGLTISEYQDLIEATGGHCPICKKRTRRWCIDHKHETGESFGAVCNSCNTKLLAWTFHDLEVAENLVEFLRNPPIRNMFGERFVTKKKTTSTIKSIDYRDPTSYPHGKRRRGELVKRQPRKRR